MSKVKGFVEVSTTDGHTLEGVGFRINGSKEDTLCLVLSDRGVMAVQGDSADADEGIRLYSSVDLFNVVQAFFKSKEKQ